MTDIALTFIEPDGTERAIQVSEGTSLMEAALLNGIDGIQGLCGGICSCGTCLVELDPALCATLPAPDENETAMLEALDQLKPAKRLGCQVHAGAGLQGAQVRIATQDS